MILTRDMYVPSLRWRQGEYQALARLAAATKDRVVPYITIPEVEFDFELWQPKKTVQAHVHPFAARFNAKWGRRPAWVGVHPSISAKPMGDGRDILTYVFEALRAFQASAVPVLLVPDAASPVCALGTEPQPVPCAAKAKESRFQPAASSSSVSVCLPAGSVTVAVTVTQFW